MTSQIIQFLFLNGIGAGAAKSIVGGSFFIGVD